MKIKEKSNTVETAAAPQYKLRKGLNSWALTFEGRQAAFKNERGAFYVSYLLLNPPSEPIHGLALMLKTNALYRPSSGSSVPVINPLDGKPVLLAIDAIFQQRNLGLDDAEAVAELRRKQLELEAILDDDDQIAPVKAEVTRELLEIYDYQKRNPSQPKDTAEKAVRAVRRAITRFHNHLATALDEKGCADPVLRQFAAHLEKYLLIPSARYCLRGSRIRTGVAGCFTYEPPAGVKWTA